MDLWQTSWVTLYLFNFNLPKYPKLDTLTSGLLTEIEKS